MIHILFKRAAPCCFIAKTRNRARKRSTIQGVGILEGSSLEENRVCQDSNCTAPHAALVVAALPLAIQLWKTKDVQVYENAENGRNENEK